MERDENSMDSRSPIVSNPPSWRREEMAAIALCWGAKRGTTTALLGLYRGREALLEAEHTVEFANKLSEPAVQAESEGLAGRAWRTIGETIGQDLRRRETYTALKALSARKRKWQERQKKEDEKRTSLSQTNHEVGSEAKADSDGQANGSGSSKNDAANTKVKRDYYYYGEGSGETILLAQPNSLVYLVAGVSPHATNGAQTLLLGPIPRPLHQIFRFLLSR